MLPVEREELLQGCGSFGRVIAVAKMVVGGDGGEVVDEEEEEEEEFRGDSDPRPYEEGGRGSESAGVTRGDHRGDPQGGRGDPQGDPSVKEVLSRGEQSR